MATVAQACKALGLKRSGIIYRIKKGYLKAKKVKVNTYTYLIDDASLKLNVSLRKKKPYAKNH